MISTSFSVLGGHNAKQTFGRRHGGGESRQQADAAALAYGGLHHRAIDLHDRDVDHRTRQFRGVVERRAGQQDHVGAGFLEVVRILRELEVVRLRDDSHAGANVIPLNGVVAQVHDFDVRDEAFQKRLHRADREIHGVDDAQSLSIRRS